MLGLGRKGLALLLAFAISAAAPLMMCATPAAATAIQTPPAHQPCGEPAAPTFKSASDCPLLCHGFLLAAGGGILEQGSRPAFSEPPPESLAGLSLAPDPPPPRNCCT